jgi:uncharacterized membrane protein YwzB
MSLVGLLLALVVICLCFWAVRAILAAFSIGDPIATLVYVVLVVVVILWLVGVLGGGSLGNLRIT